MAILTGPIKLANGQPASGYLLEIDVLADAPIVAGDVIVPSTIMLTLNQQGDFSVDLIPSSSYTPASSYQFTIIDPATLREERTVRTMPANDATFEEIQSLGIFVPDGTITPDMLKWLQPPETNQLASVGVGGFVPVDAGTGGGGGATTQQVQDAINQMVHAFARDANNTLTSIGPSDLQDADNLIVYDSSSSSYVRMSLGAFKDGIEDIVHPWARADNDDPIPAGKLTNAPGGAGSTSFEGLSDTPGSLPTEAEGNKVVLAHHEGLSFFDDVPDANIPDAITRDSEIYNWAKEGNTDTLPDSKIPAQQAPTGGAADLDFEHTDLYYAANEAPVQVSTLQGGLFAVSYSTPRNLPSSDLSFTDSNRTITYSATATGSILLAAHVTARLRFSTGGSASVNWIRIRGNSATAYSIYTANSTNEAVSFYEIFSMEPGDKVFLNASSSITWLIGQHTLGIISASGSGGLQLSNATPQQDGASGSAGDANTVSRSNHRHQDKTIVTQDIPNTIQRVANTEPFAIRGNTSRIPNSKLHKVGDAISTENPQGYGLTRREQIASIARSVSGHLLVDVIAETEFNAVNTSGPGEPGSADLDLAFSIGSNNYKFRSTSRTSAGDLSVEVRLDGSNSAPNSRSDLNGYGIRIIGPDDEWTYNFADATYIAGSGGVASPDGYEWSNTPVIYVTGSQYTFQLEEPLDKNNYLPGNGLNYQILGHDADGPRWRFGSVREVLNDSTLSVNHTPASTPGWTTPVLLPAAYDLDTMPHGIFIYDILVLKAGGNAAHSLENDDDFVGDVFTRRLGLSAAYASQSNTGLGWHMGRKAVLQSGSVIGHFDAYLARRTDGRLLWHVRWINEGSAGTGNVNVQARLHLAFEAFQ